MTERIDDTDRASASLSTRPSSLVVRGAQPHELAATAELVNLVFRTSRGRPATMHDEYPLMFCAENSDNLRIVIEDGRQVAHVGLSIREVLVAGCRLTVGSIGAVATHPDVRERGYGSLALQDAIGVLEARRAGVMIVSGGRGLYRRAECVDAGRTYVYTLPPAGWRLPGPADVQVTTIGPERLDSLIAVQQREPVRFVRSRDDWARLVRAHPMAFEPAMRRRLLLAEGAGASPLAYAVVQAGHAEAGQPPPPLRVVEHAGDPSALLAILHAAAGEPGTSSVRVVVPADNLALNRLLRQIAPTPPQPDGIPTTLRLIDPVALLEHLNGYLVERLGAAAAAALTVGAGSQGSFVLRLGEATATAPDRAALTWLMLGTHHTERLAWLEGAPASLRAALDLVFPIALPLPGLNYV